MKSKNRLKEAEKLLRILEGFCMAIAPDGIEFNKELGLKIKEFLDETNND